MRTVVVRGRTFKRPLCCRCAVRGFQRAHEKPANHDAEDARVVAAIDAETERVQQRIDALSERVATERRRIARFQEDLDTISRETAELPRMGAVKAEMASVTSRRLSCAESVRDVEAEIRMAQALASRQREEADGFRQRAKALELAADHGDALARQKMDSIRDITLAMVSLGEGLAGLQRQLDEEVRRYERDAHRVRRRIREVEDHIERLESRKDRIRREAGIVEGDPTGDGDFAGDDDPSVEAVVSGGPADRE
jgi:chromosome segregation ATPase